MKGKSYWRRRRDVLCNVECDPVYDPDSTIPEPLQSVHQGPENCFENLDILVDEILCQDPGNMLQDPEICGDDDETSKADDLVDFWDDTYVEGTSDSESTDSDSLIIDDKLPNLLAQWATQFSVPLTALGNLLHLLHPYHPMLPLDPKTLLHTPREVVVKQLTCGGYYYHFGIRNNIEKRFRDLPSDVCFEKDDLPIQINIDGLPIFKSSSLQLWPILGILKGSAIEKPFAIGIYSGNQKPLDVAEFLNDFVTEVKNLRTAGLDLGGRHYAFHLHSFVCDAPARSMLKNTKGHSGYSGCDRCVQRGEWDGKVLFSVNDAPLRSNVAFDEMADEDHHRGPSPLQGLGIGLVSHFCLDYMHLVCLGVVRRLIHLWMRGPLNCRLSASLLLQISERLANVRLSIPCEFARKPRPLLEVDRWKATEFRQFLLYTGPVVLKGILSDRMYRHFVVFSTAIYCCLNADLCSHYAEYARQLLVWFVQEAADIYGKQILVYNVHSLIHVVDDVLLFGNLDNVSCFPFENYLGHIKKLIRSPYLPLQQIIGRLTEFERRQTCDISQLGMSFAKQHENGPLPDEFKTCTNVAQYCILKTNGFVFKLGSRRDSFFYLQDGNVGQLRNIVCTASDTFVVYEQFLKKTDFYDFPLCSTDLGICVVSRLSSMCHVASHSAVRQKCMALPYKDGHSLVVIPFAHKQ